MPRGRPTGRKNLGKAAQDAGRRARNLLRAVDRELLIYGPHRALVRLARNRLQAPRGTVKAFEDYRLVIEAMLARRRAADEDADLARLERVVMKKFLT